jgi:hypothetical protein
MSNIDSTPYAFGEDIGELGETIRFLKSPGKSLFNLSKGFKRSVRKKERLFGRRNAINHATALADVWLEWRFAVAPLVRSMNSLIEAYQTDVHQPLRRTGRGFWSDSSDSGTQTVQVGYYGGNTCTFTVHASSSVEHRAGILHQVSNPASQFQYKYGLRGKDLPLTLWQLVPLSFMVDRVYDISSFTGSVVNLLDPNVDILAAWLTTKTEYLEEFSLQSVNESGYPSSVAPDTIFSRSFRYDRVIWSPGISDAVPGFTPKNLVKDAKSITDLLALSLKNFK